MTPKCFARCLRLEIGLCLAFCFFFSSTSVSATEADRGVDIPDETVDITLRVASDGSGDFTKIQPAVDRAVTLLRRGRRVKVSIGPGVYREKVTIDLDADDPAREPLLIIEGDAPETTVISGGEVEGWGPETWQAVNGHPGVYVHEWTRGSRMYPGPWANNFARVFKDTAGRNEALWVGGRHLIPVALDLYTWVDPDGPQGNFLGQNHPRNRDNQPGEFRYDGVDERGLGVLDRPWTFAISNHPEASDAFRGKVFIRLPDGVTPQQAGPIEVASNVSDHWFSGWVTFRRKNNLVLRDLSVTRAGGSLMAYALSFHGTKNVLLERVHSVGNGTGGIVFSVRTRRGEPGIRPSRISVIDSVARDNGLSGMGGSIHDSLVERSDFSFNNWRAFAGGWAGWTYAGVKNGSTQRTTYRDCTFVGNQAVGLWFDIDCADVLYERCFAYANYGAGIFMELSGKDPKNGNDVARHCVSAYNNDFGYKLSSVRRATVTDSLAVNNRGLQVALVLNQNEPGREPNTAEEFEFTRVHDNLIVSQRLNGQATGTANPQADRGYELLKAYDGRGNRYLVADNGEPPFIAAGYKRVDFRGWLRGLEELGAVGAEIGSSLQEVPSINSQRLDFFRSEPNLLTEWCEQRGVTIPWDLIERFRANPTWTSDRMEPFPVGPKP